MPHRVGEVVPLATQPMVDFLKRKDPSDEQE
jgi:hypothetical protein